MIYITLLFYVVSVLFRNFTTEWLTLPASFAQVSAKPWTLLTYGLVHFDLFHILSNLIVLYFIGNLFLDFFSPKKFLIYYILGLLVGGILFIGYYELSNQTTNWSLIGASAAVTSIFIGVAAKVPHYALRLRFVGSVELWVLAAIWIAISALGSTGVNAGSGVAHLGGAITGYLLTAYFNEGASVEKILKRKPKAKKNSFKKVYRTKSSIKTKPSHAKKKKNQQKVDAILDKISKSGYEALTKDEKDFLFNQKEN